MPPPARQRTKLGKNRPGVPADQQEQGDQGQREDASRGRAGGARPDARDASARHAGVERSGPGLSGDDHAGTGHAGAGGASDAHPGAESAGAPDPTPERPTPASADGTPTSAGGGRATPGRVQWTADAKALRAELAAWAGARRKAGERAAEVRRLIASGRVPDADARAIVLRAAESTGEPVGEVARAAGLDPADFEP